MNKLVEKHYWCIFASLIILACVLCFVNLGGGEVYLWDEARHGINAYEMLKQNDYVVNYYNGQPDYWNLKPPISYYFIMLGYKIFGYNAWGLRFFSAFSYLLLIVIVAIFLKKNFNKKSSLISMLMFLACYQYFEFHFIRSGDADALFVLFVSISIISLYLSSKNSNWLHLTALMFALSFLTKSFHAIILLPIILAYLIFTKGFKNIKWWQYITIILSAVVPLAIWFILRFRADGLKFFKLMIDTDLLNRSSTAMEGHEGYLFIYLVNIVKNFVLIFCVFAILINIILNAKKKEKLNNIQKLVIISFISILLIYAIAKTKLVWYIFPLCTPLVIGGSVSLIDILSADSMLKTKLKTFILVCSAVFLFVGTTLSGVLSFNTSESELQNFITSAQIKTDSVVYFQSGSATQLDQASLLVFEWSHNKLIENGGIEAFKNSNNSYLIVLKENWTPLEDVKILQSSSNYLLIYKQ